MSSFIAPASPEMMDLLHKEIVKSIQPMFDSPSTPVSGPENEISLTIRAPSSQPPACYNCAGRLTDEEDDCFCSETCEIRYDYRVEAGQLTPDFTCDDCGTWMNPREGIWQSICNRCESVSPDEPELTTAQLYCYMWPHTKSHPHEYETARDAVYEFLDRVNNAHGELSKCEQARFLFNYIADHGHCLLKNEKLVTVILEKMMEFEQKETMMRVLEMYSVFDRLRMMIMEIQEKKE